MAILIIIALIIAGVAGYRIGSHFTRKENETLSTQNRHLQEFSNQWANAAKFSTELGNTISQQQVSNTSANIQTVINLLNNIQLQQGQTNNSKDQEEIQKIINQVRQITIPGAKDR